MGFTSLKNYVTGIYRAIHPRKQPLIYDITNPRHVQEITEQVIKLKPGRCLNVRISGPLSQWRGAELGAHLIQATGADILVNADILMPPYRLRISRDIS